MKHLVIATICLLTFNACTEKGPAEKFGERIDEVADNVKEGDAPLKKKGIAEKTGESIDDAVHSNK